MAERPGSARRPPTSHDTARKSGDRLDVFPSDLGWMAMLGSQKGLRRLTFGHDSPEAAVRATPGAAVEKTEPTPWNRPLKRRLQAYAEGERDDFRDVRLDLGPLAGFRRRVLSLCRHIPYGSTLTYGQLAAWAGSPRAARAVGQCMAANPVPLVIPCHRVISSNGGLGGYSAAGGLRLKRRLLQRESRGDV